MANKKHLKILEQGVETWNNWRRENTSIRPDLRGEDFTGKDFSGADFSKAFIQGTNFTKTKLKKTKFTRAEAGLTSFGVIKLLIGMFFISALLGFIFLFCSALLGYFWTPEAMNYHTPFYGILALVLFVIIIGSVSCFGLKPELVSVIIGGTLMLTAFGWFLAVAEVPGALYRDEVPALTLPGTALVAGAIAEAFFIVTAEIVDGKILGGHNAWVSSLAGALFGIFVAGLWTNTVDTAIDMARSTHISTVNINTFVKSIIALLVLATTLVSIYIARSTLANKEENALILIGAVFLAATGGTSFRGADLTDADFTHAKLRSADFRNFQAALGSANSRRDTQETKETKLIRTRWREAQELNRVRPGTTYLQYKEICELLSTGKGENKHFDKLLNLQGINLEDANLANSSFIGSNLKQANLEKANLERANLKSSTLQKVNLRNANLIYSSLIESDLNQANLEGANLQNADLKAAILSQANLQYADLSGVKLVQAQLYESDLTRATLTGAYIEDWGISVTTKLLQVHCDYIYMKYPTEKEPYSDRRPADKTKNFKPGEFASLVGIVANTVDLVFQYGINWKAFFETFTKLQQEYQDVSIQAIEKKPEDTFVIKLNVSEEANKPLIENHVIQLYETNLKILEAQYRAELKGLEAHHKDEIISLYKKQGADMKEIAKMLASRPIDIEAKTVVEHQSKNVEVEMNFQGPVTGAAGKVEGNQVIYSSEQKQTFTEVATEIVKLLDYFEQNDPSIIQAQQIVKTATENQPEILDAEIIQEAIQCSPTLKQRIVAAGTAAYIETVKMLLPPLGIAIEAVKAYKNPK